ncbi:MAG: hypothetical protein B6U87_01500 [Candidatus Aenigmarchaeota archaeon ex4484_52]|nr:MAG: hypothetical protein B6U87_01500 [Candidatus Aenigmarchaeota archaeon ex4484_52]
MGFAISNRKDLINVVGIDLHKEINSHWKLRLIGCVIFTKRSLWKYSKRLLVNIQRYYDSKSKLEVK